jgi:hypothetical protein
MPQSDEAPKRERERWSRADKINRWIAVSAVIAALIALAPWAKNVYDWVQRPRAAISSPFNGEHVRTNTFGVAGTAANVPADADLWLVVRSGVEGRWYPIGRFLVTNGKWTSGVHDLCPGPHDIEVFLVPDNGGAQFFTYVGSKAQHQGVGIDSIPPTAVLEGTSQIIVPGPSKPGC